MKKSGLFTKDKHRNTALSYLKEHKEWDIIKDAL
jgi:hypothetical protein